MEESLDKYRKIKDLLDEYYSDSTVDEDFNNLVRLDGIPDNVKTTLILLHSNYKAELKEQKNLIYRVLYRMVDGNVELFSSLTTGIKNTSKRTEEVNSNLKLDMLYKLFIPIILSICLFFGMAWLNPHALELAVGAVHKTLTFGFGDPNANNNGTNPDPNSQVPNANPNIPKQ